MAAKNVIELKNVVKEYKLYKQKKWRIIDVLTGSRNYKTKVAVNGVSFKVKRGESVALIGLNGAGKSTILKMITGVVFPTQGEVIVKGRVSALLELTAGFDAMFTGRENIYIKGMLLGMDKTAIEAIEDEIIEFADIGEYIDQPVRTYSSGMKARLGFAKNANIDPDILVIDEALSVGDRNFRAKCREKIREIRSREHVTVLLVTHSAGSAESMCDRGLVLESGKLVFDGEISEAVKFYGGDEDD
jgi:teichoic acid transport system ATP-binding protein